ncbi:CPBP family intramembrane glutamic endopeptidase [Marinicrinis sediminis]|uniref:CPBP family intramembrane glutamic endopeptidase n=1 Tax=Marinicrinis sediminis TaxID=1652465 RepID=A0ABW5RDV9_9BACL
MTKKFKFRFEPLDMNQIDDRLLLINLYITQLFTLLLGALIMLFQGRNVFTLFAPVWNVNVLIWGGAVAVGVLILDLVISNWVPDDVTDDGGVNEKLFKARAVWHILVIALVVSICEEVLFRGAIQHAWGPYWTSILFAAIHFRYLKHWLMTGMVFGISYTLGWIYTYTGTLWTPILAHFIIDFVLGMVIRFGKGREDEHA